MCKNPAQICMNKIEITSRAVSNPTCRSQTISCCAIMEPCWTVEVNFAQFPKNLSAVGRASEGRQVQ